MKLTPFFLLAATPIIAAPGLDQRVSKLEQQMKEARMETVYGNAGARTVSATPATDRYGPSFSVDFLCWKPFIGGTEFAFTDYSYPNDGITFYDTALANVNFDWKFGFRTGFGYQFSDPDWDLSAVYTRVAFDQVVHRPAHPGGSVDASGFPLHGRHIPTLAGLTSAKASWSTSFNVFDIDLARAYFLRPRLSVHPRIGVRTAWIRQQDKALFSEALVLDPTYPLKYVNSTAGAGLLGGSELRWHWSNQWSLSSNATASLIYGKMTSAIKAIYLSGEEEAHIKTNTYKILPNASLDVGLTWEMAWKVVHWSMTAGYEFQYWWRQNQRPHLDYGITYSWVRQAEDIGFHGFKFNTVLDF